MSVQVYLQGNNILRKSCVHELELDMLQCLRPREAPWGPAQIADLGGLEQAGCRRHGNLRCDQVPYLCQTTLGRVDELESRRDDSTSELDTIDDSRKHTRRCTEPQDPISLREGMF